MKWSYLYICERKIYENNETFLCNGYDFDQTKKKSAGNFKSYEEYINKKQSENTINTNNYDNEEVKLINSVLYFQ